MKRLLSLILLSLFLLLPSANADASQTTIMFDDFVSSTLSPNWGIVSFGANPTSNITQTAGYLTITNNRYAGTNQILGAVIANGTGATIDSTSNATFLQMVVKEQPFNLTSIPLPGLNRQAGMEFGFISTGTGGFGVQMFEEDSAVNNLLGWGGYRSAIGLAFAKPNSGGGGTIHCFSKPNLVDLGGCSPQASAITYTPSILNNPFDLNTQHIFTLRAMLWQGTDTLNGQKSWVALQVDGNAWLNMSQTSCLCISPPATSFAQLYPFIGSTFCATGNGITCGKNAQSNQSVSTNVDYVLITNFIPKSLPAGQLLASAANPPSRLPQPYNLFGQSDSLPNFVQFYANSFAPGNIYAGGLLLTGMIITVIAGTLGVVIWRLKKGIREMGFMWSLSSLGIVFFTFYCGIVPLWLPVIQTLISAGIVFGIIRTGSPGQGGVVPD